eukprot:TRINITY_DN31514_c0_g1_i1.p1 TRINITY_DN31514_c0_g1~~TRINITY_DN31514_c0_g1_i1.p1  ORF type:complete len:348 (-),score=93.62 TRINITY_DN31514_c0_g1_i1:517-1560(-)
MARAGERYEEVTGNIWSYAKRGDMTGVKAALLRNVDVDCSNTAGWTPLHAAAAGGQAQVIRALLRAKADIGLRDRGGNLAAHEAARGGHLQCLEVLQDAGVDLSNIRLSQTKGTAVRALVQEATRKAAKVPEAGETAEGDGPVGYARQKQKSCAFWGPRRTPISNKIKREILKEKRKKQEEGADASGPVEAAPDGEEDHDDDDADTADEQPREQQEPPDPAIATRGRSESNAAAEQATVAEHDLEQQSEPYRETLLPQSYKETVRAIKQQARVSRKARQAAKRADRKSGYPAAAPEDEEETSGGEGEVAAAAGRRRFAPPRPKAKDRKGFSALLADSDAQTAEESSS